MQTVGSARPMRDAIAASAKRMLALGLRCARGLRSPNSRSAQTSELLRRQLRDGRLPHHPASHQQHRRCPGRPAMPVVNAQPRSFLTTGALRHRLSQPYDPRQRRRRDEHARRFLERRGRRRHVEHQRHSHYLQAIRDGGISSSSINFATTNIGATRTRNITLYNYRFRAPDSHRQVGDRQRRLRSLRLRSGRLRPKRTVPGTSTAAPGSCTRDVHLRAPASSDTRRGTGIFTVDYSGNAGLDQVDQPVSLSGSVPSPRFSFTPGATTTSARFDLGQSSDVNVGTIAQQRPGDTRHFVILAQPPAPVGRHVHPHHDARRLMRRDSFNLGAGASARSDDPLHADRSRHQNRHALDQPQRRRRSPELSR